MLTLPRLGLGLLVLGAGAATCARPQPQMVLQNVAILHDEAPRYVSLPPMLRDWDVICIDVNQPSTCATVGEVKQFLRTARVEP